jgi:hypothetical protein
MWIPGYLYLATVGLTMNSGKIQNIDMWIPGYVDIDVQKIYTSHYHQLVRRYILHMYDIRNRVKANTM